MIPVWQQWWDLIYDALVYAVSLNWSALLQIGQDIRDWWGALWENILNLIQSVESQLWAVRTSLRALIFEWHGYAIDAVTLLETWALEQIQAVIDWAQAELASIDIYIDSLIDTVYAWVEDLLASWLDAAWAFIQPYVVAVETWVTDTFGWLLDSYTLFTEWLVSVRDAVTWLATYAWTSLTSFLADPWGFVLGQLGATIIDTVNWWLEWATPLSDFLTQDLPGLRNFMAQGLTLLQTFVDNPLQTILDLLYPVFLDWLENLIAENW